jgi:hypothetical protein
MSVATADVNGTARTTANPPNSTPHDCDRHERDERRQPDRLPDVGVDDVALELAHDEPKQGESGDVQGLRDADGEDKNRAEERADHWHDLDQKRRGWSPSESGSAAIVYLLTSGFIRTKSPLAEVASMKSARSPREMRGCRAEAGRDGRHEASNRSVPGFSPRPFATGLSEIA